MRLPVVALSLIAAAATVGLAGCEKQTKAPFETGVCMHVIEQKDGTLKFNPVARNVPSLEFCAAELEGMRLRRLPVRRRRKRFRECLSSTAIRRFFERSKPGFPEPPISRFSAD